MLENIFIRYCLPFCAANGKAVVGTHTVGPLAADTTNAGTDKKVLRRARPVRAKKKKNPVRSFRVEEAKVPLTLTLTLTLALTLTLTSSPLTR